MTCNDTASKVGAEIAFRPKPYEVDFTGFVSNTVAPRWMETLRICLMDQYFPSFDTSKPEHLSVIAETKIKYLKPIRYRDVVLGRAEVEAITRLRWIINFSFYLSESGKVAMRGQQIGVFIDPVSLSPVRIPAAINKAFRPESCAT